MKKPVILFDIDHTLFDTDKLRKKTNKAILKILKIKNNKIDLFILAENKAVRQDKVFKPSTFSEMVAKHFKKEKKTKEITKVFADKSIFKTCLYPNTVRILKKLSRQFRLGIFSKGYEPFQLFKTEASKELFALLDKNLIFIYRNKKKYLPNILKRFKDNRLIIVDDSQETIKSFLKLNPKMIAVWVKRSKKYSADKESMTKKLNLPYVINKLDQLFMLLGKENV
jgi:FMN phosphatase YigB (HAD superfamily)